MELYIVRHGTTDRNAERRFQGVRDIELNENGRKLAAELGYNSVDLSSTEWSVGQIYKEEMYVTIDNYYK